MIPGRPHIIGRMTVMDAFRAVGSSGKPSMTQVIWYYDLPEVGSCQFVRSISRAAGSPRWMSDARDGEHGPLRVRQGYDRDAPWRGWEGSSQKREIR